MKLFLSVLGQTTQTSNHSLQRAKWCFLVVIYLRIAVITYSIGCILHFFSRSLPFSGDTGRRRHYTYLSLAPKLRTRGTVEATVQTRFVLSAKINKNVRSNKGATTYRIARCRMGRVFWAFSKSLLFGFFKISFLIT